MRLLLAPFRFLYVVYAILLFVALMVPVFIWSAAVSTLGRIRGGNLVYRGCMAWADLWFPLIFIRHRNINASHPKGQAYIYVANHISYLDAALIPRVFRDPLRPLGKAELSKVPVFGLIYRNAIVSVDRSSPANRSRSVQVLMSVLRKGISVLVFPEGSFNETGKPLKEFYDGAFRIAIETGTPLRPVLFLDAYDRMHYRSVFSLSPGRSRALFLPEVSVAGLHVRDVPRLKEKVYRMMEEELLKQKASWIGKAN